MSFALALSVFDPITGTPVVDGLTTTGLSVGDVGYISSNNTLTKTDATIAASSRAYGVNDGTVGEMVIAGAIALVKFTTAGGSPAAGAPVYLAPSTEEAGAAGKLTAVAPSTVGQFIAEVGTCQDPSGYAANKTATILWKPKNIISL